MHEQKLWRRLIVMALMCHSWWKHFHRFIQAAVFKGLCSPFPALPASNHVSWPWINDSMCNISFKGARPEGSMTNAGSFCKKKHMSHNKIKKHHLRIKSFSSYFIYHKLHIYIYIIYTYINIIFQQLVTLIMVPTSPWQSPVWRASRPAPRDPPLQVSLESGTSQHPFVIIIIIIIINSIIIIIIIIIHIIYNIVSKKISSSSSQTIKLFFRIYQQNNKTVEPKRSLSDSSKTLHGLHLDTWVLTLQGRKISYPPLKVAWKMIFPFAKVGYVSSQERTFSSKL